MSPQDMRDSAKAQPFEPFRMVLTDGTAYEIRHPDLLWVGQHACLVGFAGNPQSPFFERSVKVALVHVVQLEPL
jgi:hypothetical protein